MLLSAKECRERFGNNYQIAALIKLGELKKVAPGLYSDGTSHHEVEILQMRYPSAVVTMLSAYYYYDLTDNVPDRCHLAVERGSTKISDPSVVEYFVPKGTGRIGVENSVLQGIPMRIFDKERLLIETVRMRTKMPYDLYHEVIGNFRQIADELYPAKMEDYLDAFPKREVLFDVIRKEVL